MPDACFCEAIRDGAVRQPANTWSCVAFILVGIVMLARTVADRSQEKTASNTNLLIARPIYGVLYGGALILIGIGSAFYHASLSFLGQFFDVFGMYLLGTFILLYNFSRLRPISASTIAALYVGLNGVLAVLLYTVPELRRYAFGTLLIVALGLEMRVRRRGRAMADGRLLWIALAMIGAGFAIWILDVTRALCSPASVIQGHALWHLAGAAAAWFLYRYYRSEIPSAAANSIENGRFRRRAATPRDR